MKNFLLAARLYGWTPFPVTEKTLLLYGGHVFNNETVSGRTFENRCDSIRAVHHQLGLKCSVRREEMPTLFLLKRAFKRVRPCKQNEKTAVGVDDGVLTMLMSRLTAKTHDVRTQRAVLAFAYGGMLRVGEYTYGPTAKNRPRWENITEMSANRVVFTFRHSKGNQDKRVERVVICCRCPQICGVHELEKMRKGRTKNGPRDYVFQFSDGSKPTADYINKLLQNLADDCGIDSDKVTAHCLRAGAITDALAAGIPGEIVQTLSRHRDPKSMAPYKKFSALTLSSIQQNHYNQRHKR